MKLNVDLAGFTQSIIFTTTVSLWVWSVMIRDPGILVGLKKLSSWLNEVIGVKWLMPLGQLSPLFILSRKLGQRRFQEGRSSRPQVPIGPLIKASPYNDDIDLTRASYWSRRYMTSLKVLASWIKRTRLLISLVFSASFPVWINSMVDIIE